MSGRCRDRRCAGERGSGAVVMVVSMFALTAGAVIWLARDVDRSVANRSAAQSIAFQAARAGAQRVDVASLRTGAPLPEIDAAAAKRAAADAAARLFAGYEVDGSIASIAVGEDRVRVEVIVREAGRATRGVAAARFEVGS